MEVSKYIDLIYKSVVYTRLSSRAQLFPQSDKHAPSS